MFSMTGEEASQHHLCSFFLADENVYVMFSVVVPSLQFSHGDCCYLVSGSGKYHIAVAGRGMQMVEFSPPEDDSMKIA